VIPHYGSGIVIHRAVKIGDRAKIFQGVTMGRREGPGHDSGQPIQIEIGEDSLIGAGAKILASGSLRVGPRSFIGANAVVLSDVPADSVAVGIPARILRNGDNADAIA
jgi:serine O-acetyltransferase